MACGRLPDAGGTTATALDNKYRCTNCRERMNEFMRNAAAERDSVEAARIRQLTLEYFCRNEQKGSA